MLWINPEIAIFPVAIARKNMRRLVKRLGLLPDRERQFCYQHSQEGDDSKYSRHAARTVRFENGVLLLSEARLASRVPA